MKSGNLGGRLQSSFATTSNPVKKGFNYGGQYQMHLLSKSRRAGAQFD